MKSFLMILLPLLLSTVHAFDEVEVNPATELQRLQRSLDRNLDEKITSADKAERFTFTDKAGNAHEVTGEYHLSNLFQELRLLSEEKKSILEGDLIYEDPVSRSQRFIRNYFWRNLRRRVPFDSPEKLYVAKSDRGSRKAYGDGKEENVSILPALDFKVLWGLEARILPLGVKGKRPKPVTFLSSGRDFNTLRGMDSYFALQGLIVDGEVELAFDLVKAILYEIEYYGRVLSENQSSHLLTGQPPFVSSMVRLVFEKLPRSKETREWLRQAIDLIVQDYEENWMGEERLTNSGLSRYGGMLLNPKDLPEYEALLEEVAQGREWTVAKVRATFAKSPEAFPEVLEFLREWGCMRESGHEGTHRFKIEGKERCTEIAPVDLNSALHKTELDLAYLIKYGLRGKYTREASSFLERAKKRKLLIRTFLWDEKENLFFDYDVVRKRRLGYLAASTFYPLWAFDANEPELALLSREEALKFTAKALAELESSGGVFASAESSVKLFGLKTHPRLWDYPNGLAPHQMILWQGLSNFSQVENQQRLIYKWLYLLTKTARDHSGAFPKAFDLEALSPRLMAPLKNRGLDFSYVPRQGFVWTNASYQLGLSLLSPAMRPMLEKLVPYEKLKD